MSPSSEVSILKLYGDVVELQGRLERLSRDVDEIKRVLEDRAPLTQSTQAAILDLAKLRDEHGSLKDLVNNMRLNYQLLVVAFAVIAFGLDQIQQKLL